MSEAGGQSSCWPILGVAIVGKKNQPLFVHSFEDGEEERDLELNLTVHSMLDIIDERAQTATVTAEDNFYLGFLSLFGRFCTYAMMGPTLIKVFIVLDAEHEPTPKEENLKRVLFSLHLAYLDYICNPFVDVSEDEENPTPALHDSPAFLKRVARICELNNFVKA